MEALQFDEGVFLQADDGITWIGRIEHIVVNRVGGGADTVYTADSLHQTCGIPRAVVVDNHIGPMQVDALGQHIRSDDNVIVVVPFFLILCVKVGFDGVAQTVATFGANGKNVAAIQALFQLLFQIIDGIYAFAEHHELAARVLFLVE